MSYLLEKLSVGKSTLRRDSKAPSGLLANGYSILLKWVKFFFHFLTESEVLLLPGFSRLVLKILKNKFGPERVNAFLSQKNRFIVVILRF